MAMPDILNLGLLDIFGLVVTFLGLALLALWIWAILSPFEALGWWAGWFGDKIYVDDLPADGLVRQVRPGAESYVIYLSGVGRVSGETLGYREQEFLRRLASALPKAVVIDDIFPYSVNNMALTGRPLFARLWRWSLRAKRTGPQWAGMLINVRNIFQTAVSCDGRYGPMYNSAAAEVMLHTLLRYDYTIGSGAPVYIVGYSGAGQIAVGAAAYLRDWIKAPLYVISLGGIFVSSPGLLAADHVFHLEGTSDLGAKVGRIAPGRWPVFPRSEWNRARRRGSITWINMGPMDHTGKSGYMDTKTLLPNGRPYMDHTVGVIARIISEVTATGRADPELGGALSLERAAPQPARL